MPDGDVDLDIGGGLSRLAQGGLVRVKPAMLEEELMQPPRRVFGEVVGVFHRDFGEGFGGAILARKVGGQFLRVHIFTRRHEDVGELDEVRTLLCGLVVPRQADDAGEVGADRQGLGLFDFGGRPDDFSIRSAIHSAKAINARTFYLR